MYIYICIYIYIHRVNPIRYHVFCRLGECKTEGKVRGEVSATYLDYPKVRP